MKDEVGPIDVLSRGLGHNDHARLNVYTNILHDRISVCNHHPLLQPQLLQAGH